MKRLRLHQELFLLAHDDNGTPYLHQPSLNIGLAAAVLIDLTLTERITTHDGYLTTRGVRPVGDPVLDTLHTTITHARQPHTADEWLRTIAADIHHRTTGGLLATGMLTRVTTRRTFGRRHEQLLPTDPTHAGLPRAAIRYAIYGRHYPDLQCAALCGLIVTLRLERTLHLNFPTNEIVTTLRHITDQHCPQTTDILTVVDEQLGHLATQVYR